MSKPPIVVDLGAAFIKAGFSTSQGPDLIIPNVTGRPITNPLVNIKDVMIGNEALQLYRYLSIERQIENGIIKSWEGEKLIFDYIFKKLETNPDGQKILIADPQTSNDNQLNDNRKKLVEILFESFNLESINMCNQALLSLYDHGIVTGVVINSGYDYTTVTPAYDNFILSDHVVQIDCAGHAVQETIIDLITKSGTVISESENYNFIQKVQNKLCYASKGQKITNKKRLLSLEDGRQIRVSEDVFQSPEIMFTETHFNYANRGSKDYMKFKGISQLIYDTINSCDMTMRKDMFRNIIFCGGNTRYPGFVERTIDEIKCLTNTKVRGEGDETKNNLSDVLTTSSTTVFVGGCVLANLIAEKSKNWMHLNEYKEIGASKLIQNSFS